MVVTRRDGGVVTLLGYLQVAGTKLPSPSARYRFLNDGILRRVIYIPRSELAMRSSIRPTPSNIQARGRRGKERRKREGRQRKSSNLKCSFQLRFEKCFLLGFPRDICVTRYLRASCVYLSRGINFNHEQRERGM